MSTINFLVKLANYLDDKEKHSLAAEVDSLIQKIAAEPLANLMSKVVSIAAGQAKEVGPNSGESAQQLFTAITTSPEYSKLSGEVKSRVDAVVDMLDRIASAENQGQPVLPVYWQTVSGYAKRVGEVMPAGRSMSKQQASMISEIQKMLGILEPTGRWDAQTDQLFNAFMAKNYSQYVAGGQFRGSLTQAYNLMNEYFDKAQAAPGERSQEKAREQEAMKGLPKTPGLDRMPQMVGWRSSKGFDLSKGNIQNLLNEIETAGRRYPGGGVGWGQKAINQAEATSLNQADFERDLVGIATKARRGEAV